MIQRLLLRYVLRLAGAFRVDRLRVVVVFLAGDFFLVTLFFVLVFGLLFVEVFLLVVFFLELLFLVFA